MRGYVAAVGIFGIVCLYISFSSQQAVTGSTVQSQSASLTTLRKRAAGGDDSRSNGEEVFQPSTDLQGVDSTLFRSIEPDRTVDQVRSSTFSLGEQEQQTAAGMLGAVRKQFWNSMYTNNELPAFLKGAAASTSVYDPPRFQHLVNTLKRGADVVTDGGGASSRKDEDEAIKSKVQLFQWSPGGVLGASIADMEAMHRRVVEETRSSFDQQQLEVTASAGKTHKCFITDERNHRNDEPLQRVLMNLTSMFAQMDSMTPHGDDCRYFLTPLHRASCVVLDALSDSSVGSSSAYTASNCRVLAPCADWVRGTFSVAITPALLSSVFHRVVIPRLIHTEDSIAAQREFSQQLLHGEGNWNELLWLMRRSKSMDNDLNRRNRIADRIAKHEKQGNNNANIASRNSTLRSPSLVSDIFQGARISVSASSQHAQIISSSDLAFPTATTADSSALTLDGLSLIASLWAILSGHTHSGISRKEADDTSPPPPHNNNINVMVFNGDSVNREIFHRLIHYIRYNGRRRKINTGTTSDPTTKPSGRREEGDVLPHFHYATHYDMVYAVHSTHDELLGFHTPQTNGASSLTVGSYFQSVQEGRRARGNEKHNSSRASPNNDEKNHKERKEQHPPVAIVYIVWLWDPFTTMPRGIAFSPHRSLSSSSSRTVVTSQVKRRKGNRTISLAGVDVDAAFLVQGTAFWERVQGEQLMSSVDRIVTEVNPPAPAAGTTRVNDAEGASSSAADVRRRRFYLVTAPSEDLLTPYPQLLAGTRNYNRSWAASNPTASLRVSSSTQNFNLRKNIGYFRWLQHAARIREQQAKTLGTTSKASSSHDRLLRFSSVQILDKAKVQFIGEPMGDKIHFTCRGGFATGKPRFHKNVFLMRSLQDVLGGHDVKQDQLPVLCNGTATVHNLMYRIARLANAPSSLASTTTARRSSSSSTSGSTLLAHAQQSRRFADEVWTASLMDSTRLLGTNIAGSLIPSSMLLHPATGYLYDDNIHRYRREEGDAITQEQQRTVVYVYPDGNRRTCLDPGDGLLVQVMMHDAVLQEAAWAAAKKRAG
ncbi:membrane-associated protein, putative [Bodo saltans]|uniref:Membrane-associated protein, putative n=1 Tax=Bodo saltans TaxID=75058 RepID=A0A0S4KN66_BODSA|nr:membrane-associated protein, putative [Bodo saltans]|eukprot:CUI14323.1 membrane-associated protein, putative [Bodo saltans]